jgi:hypothetical protein
LAVASKPSTASEQARNRLVSKISTLFAAAVVLQAAAFLLLSEGYRYAENAVVESVAANGGQGALTLQAILLIVGFLFDLLLALLVGFYGSRLLARSILRAMPRGKKAPAQPMPFASLCAGVLIMAFSLFEWAAVHQQSGIVPWLLVFVRNAFIALLLWYAARRAIAPKAA